MNRAEFEQYFGNVTADSVAEVAAKWFALPDFGELSPEVAARTEVLNKPVGAVRAFIEQNRSGVVSLLEDRSHLAALDFVNQRLADAERMFLGDDLEAARISFHRNSGFVKEHLVEFGELSRSPQGDPTRAACLLGGAMDYMKADLSLGCTTQYGVRIAECLAAAGLQEAGVAAYVKIYGKDIVIVKRNSVEHLMYRDLERRATSITHLGDLPGGGSIRRIEGKLPDPRLN